MKRRDLPASETEQPVLCRRFISIWLLSFIFLRLLVDGFSYPFFNAFWNISFFLMTMSYLARHRLQVALRLEEVVLLLCFCAWVITSQFSRVANSGVNSQSEILANWCFLFLFLRTFSEKENGLIWKVVLASACLLALYGLYQHFWGLEETRRYLYSRPELLKNLPPTFLDRLSSDRIFSTLVYPNVLASALIMIFPLAFFVSISGPRRDSLPALLLLILTVYALYLTGSVGGFFVLLFLLQFLLIFLLAGQKRFRVFSGGLILLEIIGLVILLRSGFLPHLSGFQDRLKYWQSAWKIFQDHWLLGVGPENFRYFYLRYKIPGAMEAKHAHSLLFETLAEQGLTGALLLFGFFGLVLNRLFPATGARAGLAAGIGFAFLAGFLHSFVDFGFADPAIVGFAFFLIAWGLISRTPSIPTWPAALTKPVACLIISTIVFSAFSYLRYLRAEKILAEVGRARYAEEKLGLLRSAARIFPTGDVYYQAGDLFFSGASQTGNQEFFRPAEAAFQAAVQLNPGLVQAYRKLALLYEKEGDWRRAEAMYRKVLENYPTKKQYNLELALFYRKLGNRQGFLEFYEKSQALTAVSIEESLIVQKYLDQIDKAWVSE